MTAPNKNIRAKQKTRGNKKTESGQNRYQKQKQKTHGGQGTGPSFSFGGVCLILLAQSLVVGGCLMIRKPHFSPTEAYKATRISDRVIWTAKISDLNAISRFLFGDFSTVVNLFWPLIIFPGKIMRNKFKQT